MFIDSHCHLDFPELETNLDAVMSAMRAYHVDYGLCISVTLPAFPKILAVVERYENLYATVGVHPDYENIVEPSVADLVRLSEHGKVVGIGETGLDYFRLKGDLSWQQQRFRTHIRAAVETGKPLIIHTRASSEDTLAILEEEGASRVGGVMHCFTESWEVAQKAMEMGFYISFSGIVTFKNAVALKEVARKVPLDRMLIETDSPYLAPVPYRGKTNQPAYVVHVAEEIARLRETSVDTIGKATSANFFRLFTLAKPS